MRYLKAIADIITEETVGMHELQSDVIKELVIHSKNPNLLVDADGGDESGFARQFFSSPAVRSLFSGAETAGLPEDDMLDFPPVFEWGSPFTFEGEIAGRIFQGGAYKSFQGPPARAIATEQART